MKKSMEMNKGKSQDGQRGNTISFSQQMTQSQAVDCCIRIASGASDVNSEIEASICYVIGSTLKNDPHRRSIGVHLFELGYNFLSKNKISLSGLISRVQSCVNIVQVHRGLCEKLR